MGGHVEDRRSSDRTAPRRGGQPACVGTVRRVVVITCLHGFLGLPRDWDFLREAGFEIETPPLDAIPPRGDVLLGYSMGRRLALRALGGYRRAGIVSARVRAPEPHRVGR